MRVLVIESEEHYFLTNTSVELLEALGEVEVVLGRGLSPRNTSVKDWRDMLLEAARDRIVAHARHRWIFLTSLRRARCADLVVIQTAPEHGSLLKILTYLLFCLVLGPRTIVIVHGVDTHLPRAGLSRRLRALALRRVRGVVFGTSAMLSRYLEAAPERHRSAPATTVVPVRLAPASVTPPPAVAPDGRIRVGLLGGVTPKRRDFSLVVSALDRLEADERRRIELVTVGNCVKQRCRDITAALAERVEVDVEEGHLTEARLLERGESCHLLLAAMSTTLDYGTGRATGAIGDAIRMARPLLMSAVIDPGDGLEGLVLPFEDAEGLARLLRSSLDDLPQVNPAMLAAHRAEEVLARFCEDLGIKAPTPTP